MANKYAGPHGAWCPGCNAYLTMRDAVQRRRASEHRAACHEYAAFMAARA